MTSPAVEREPTLELGLVDYLDAIPVGTKTAVATTRVGTDLQTLVDTRGAVVRVRRTAGVDTDLEAAPRVAVEIYANTYTDAWAVADTVHDRLAGPRYFWAGGHLVDKCANESGPTEQPHPNLRVIVSVWRIVTRL